jgi:alpha-tubulin suppressor-like RCC1 family protein
MNITNISHIISKAEVEEDNKTPSFHLMPDEAVVKIVCGPLHSAAVTNKQRVFTCGYG